MLCTPSKWCCYYQRAHIVRGINFDQTRCQTVVPPFRPRSTFLPRTSIHPVRFKQSSYRLLCLWFDRLRRIICQLDGRFNINIFASLTFLMLFDMDLSHFRRFVASFIFRCTKDLLQGRASFVVPSLIWLTSLNNNGHWGSWLFVSAHNRPSTMSHWPDVESFRTNDWGFGDSNHGLFCELAQNSFRFLILRILRLSHRYRIVFYYGQLPFLYWLWRVLRIRSKV